METKEKIKFTLENAGRTKISEIAKQTKLSRYHIYLILETAKLLEYTGRNENKEVEAKIKEKENKISELEQELKSEKEKIQELQKAIAKTKADCQKAIEVEKKKIKSEVEKEKLKNFVMGVITGAIIMLLIVALILKLKGG